MPRAGIHAPAPHAPDRSHCRSLPLPSAAAPKAGAKAKPEGAKKAAAAKGSKKRAAKDKTPVTDAPAPAEGTGQI